MLNACGQRVAEGVRHWDELGRTGPAVASSGKAAGCRRAQRPGRVVRRRGVRRTFIKVDAVARGPPGAGFRQ